MSQTNRKVVEPVIKRPSRARLVAAVAAAAVATTAMTVAAPQPAMALTGKCNPKLAGTTTRVAPGSGKTVALTFDDNSLENMPELLAILRRYNVRATFFDTGKQDAKMLATVKKIAQEGHLVESHTWEHQYPTKANGHWSKPYLTNQIRTTAVQQQKQTGHVSCFFRPPGGYMNNVSAVTRSLGMQNVLWSVDTQDWSQPKYLSKAAQDAIVRRGTDLRYSNVNHPIVLMHGGKASNEPEATVATFRGNTLRALPRIIQWYQARGYRFVALDATSGLKPLPKPAPGRP
ncbi:MAG: polysaccharide deacetylase family protein [Intrasporangium sp.]